MQNSPNNLKTKFLLITTFKVSLESLLSVNSTYVTLHLHRWPDGGCPIHYYVIEYKEESQPTWRIVSNNIRCVTRSRELFIVRVYLAFLYRD